MNSNKSRNYTNKRCKGCGWKTFSFFSFDYRYCPLCRDDLEEFEMDKITASPQ